MSEDFNPAIAHIRAGDLVFQVLNEVGDDWDEVATRAQYEAWLSAQAPEES